MCFYFRSQGVTLVLETIYQLLLLFMMVTFYQTRKVTQVVDEGKQQKGCALLPEYSWQQWKILLQSTLKFQIQRFMLNQDMQKSQNSNWLCDQDNYFRNYKDQESNKAYGLLKIDSQMKDRDIITKMAYLFQLLVKQGKYQIYDKIQE
ncbi:unnamed protein product [Paramecium octaurelia]|uniref:Uncharacterized protein n=1 Tax=Paramecium octaurelia TaxID=43137 RepID=A0A8S1UF74_PAROT|nr:unnamed protein product [Paramecium octaurelia]